MTSAFALRAAACLAALSALCGPARADENLCFRNSGAVAVDLSVPVNQAFLTTMRDVGVRTIIRYYDHEDETIPGKTLRRAERDLIVGNGFDILVVFQHWNQRLKSFTPQRGKADAERSLVLALENRQTPDSAIYVGVDGHWGSPSELEAIKAYFAAAKARLKYTPFRIAAYGSGLVCNELLNAGLAEMCWLSNAKSWPGYRDFIKSGRWTLVQRLSQNCGGRNVDFNLGNGVDRDIGQFGG